MLKAEIESRRSNTVHTLSIPVTGFQGSSARWVRPSWIWADRDCGGWARMNGVRPASALYGRREAHTTGKPASERKPLVEVRSFAPAALQM